MTSRRPLTCAAQLQAGAVRDASYGQSLLSNYCDARCALRCICKNHGGLYYREHRQPSDCGFSSSQTAQERVLTAAHLAAKESDERLSDPDVA